MVSEETINKVAKLSRINLTKNEVDEFRKDFEEVLEFFSVLESADVSEIADLAILPVKSRSTSMREDRPEKKSQKEACLSLSNHKKDGYFKGPKAF